MLTFRLISQISLNGWNSAMGNKINIGKIILINGPSSSGKTTLALETLKHFDIPFLRFSFDLFLDNQVLPMEQIRSGKFSWDEMKPIVISGLHQSLGALARAGNNLIMDHIVESKPMLGDLIQAVSDLDVYFVGLHCSLEELKRREIQRGNRRSGDAEADLEIVHSFTIYDLELHSEDGVEENAKTLIAAWKRRQAPSALEKMLGEVK